MRPPEEYVCVCECVEPSLQETPVSQQMFIQRHAPSQQMCIQRHAPRPRATLHRERRQPAERKKKSLRVEIFAEEEKLISILLLISRK